ncbi:hypothetical protein FUSO8_12570, partial [Fusobacterium necrophorum DJ-2]
AINAPQISTPTIADMIQPTEPQVIVTAPGTVPTLSSITVAPITALNISPTPPTVGEAPTVTAPTVSTPATPNGFNPRLITPPEAPTVVLPTIASPADLNYPGTGANPDAKNYSEWSTEAGTNNSNDGNISQTSVEKGEVLKKYSKIVSNSTYNATVISKITLKGYGTGLNTVLGTGTINKLGTVAPQSGTYTDATQFFMTLLNSPYTYFGTNSKVAVLSPDDSGDHKGTVINLETEGVPGKKFSELKDDGKINQTVLDRLNNYTLQTNLKNDTYGQLYHVNKGIVEIGGNGARYIHTTYNGGGNRVNVVENRGKIVSMNYKDTGYSTSDNIVYFHSPDATASGAQHIYVNSVDGKIDMYGEKGVLTLYTASSNQLGNGDVSFINDGDINLYGRESTAIAINADEKGKLTAPSSFILNKAINIYGDNSVGLYIKNSGDGLKNNRNQIKFVFGNKSIKELEKYIPENRLIDRSKIEKANSNKDAGNADFTEGVVGVYLDNANAILNVKVPQLEMEKYAKESIGIYNKNGKIEVVDGNIKINGGEKNIALYLDGGNIDYTGNITMGGSALTKTEGNIGIYAKAGRTANLNGQLITYNSTGRTIDGIGIYSEGTVNLNDKIELKMQAGGNTQSIGVYTKGNGSLVSIKEGKGSIIDIDGKIKDGDITNKGVALYSESAGKINANGTALANGLKINSKDASSAIVSMGVNSEVNVKYATIDYEGNGYALYSDGVGKIDISGAKLNLKGKSTAFDLDLGAGTLPITLDANTRINANSDDVIVFNLKHATGLTTIGGIGDYIKGQISTKLGGISLDGLFVDSIATKYKVAAVDGGTIAIGSLDKTGISSDTTGAKKDGFQFYNRFLG